VIVPEEPVDLPEGRTLLVHVETESGLAEDESFLRAVLVPKDPEAAQ
jgi:hypothetical protein